MNNMNNIFWRFLVLIVLAISSLQAEIQKAESISFGPMQIGENRVSIDSKNIDLVISARGIKVSAEVIKHSFEWVRFNKVLLLPRARVKIVIDSNDQEMYLKYQDQIILPQYSSNKLFFSEFYISIFQPDEILIFVNNQNVGKISIVSKQSQVSDAKKNHMIDYSCAPYHLQIEGLDNEYISVGCILHKIGRFKREAGMLEIYWTSANYILDDHSLPPYIATMVSNHPVKFKVTGKKGDKRIVTMRASVPKKLHRLNFAMGLGPYYYETNHDFETEKAGWAPSAMIYSKYAITQGSSLRFFDAFVWKDGYFNNSGMYFAYDLAMAFDNRFIVIPLLGFQGLSVKYSKDVKSYHKIIYPQGLELVYLHPFGKKNYSFVMGLFTNASVVEDHYKNFWVRYGKKIFWELNYISWKKEEKKASMWGLSVGFPLMQFL